MIKFQLIGHPGNGVTVYRLAADWLRFSESHDGGIVSSGEVEVSLLELVSKLEFRPDELREMATA